MADQHQDFSSQAPPDRGASSLIYPPTPANLHFMARYLRNGGFVAIPTETVYGLAALGLDKEASGTIFKVKGRPLLDPLILHVAEPESVYRIAHPPGYFDSLVSVFWPGPLTLVMRKKKLVPDIVTAGRDTVAVRMPRHPVTNNLLRILGQPLAAPSANPFGYLSPTRPEHVADSFAEKVPYILDGGPCEIGLESTILDLTHPEKAVILRPGSISVAALGSLLPVPVYDKAEAISPGEAPKAPGMLQRHYSPRTPLLLFEAAEQPKASREMAVVLLARPNQLSEDSTHTFWLSERENPAIIARNLFTLLRKLDQLPYQEIACQTPPADSSGLLLAIRDRLQRAAAK